MRYICKRWSRQLYHFVYAGQCITEEEKSDGIVLNRTDNTYAPYSN